MTSQDPIYRALESAITSLRSFFRLVLLKILSPAAYQIWSLFSSRKSARLEDNEPTKTFADRWHDWRAKRRERRRR